MRPLNEISIQYVKGVGPIKKKLFLQLGVETIEDLFYFFPRRCEDRREMTPLSRLKAGGWHTVSGKIRERSGRRTWFTKKHVFEMEIEDKESRLACVWFNQPYLDYYLKPGSQVVLYGKVDLYKDRLQMVAPEYEIIESQEEESLSTARIVPIYPLTRGLTQRYLRKVIKNCLDRYGSELNDLLPLSLREKHGLLTLSESIANIHFPESFERQETSHKRVAFEEFFFFQISVILRRLSITHKDGIAHTIDPEWIKSFSQAFPFTLTAAQKKVLSEIAQDMRNPSPMLRLLQGDVGSGKTIVALFGCLAARNNGYQSAFMAPTEILARQHYETLQSLSAGGLFKNIRMALLVSNLKKEEKEALYRKIKSGEIDLLIGTHALIEEEVNFKNLSFAVVDEQHKFGVRQRALLSSKGLNPDVLIMTATPIPRTLCLTLYGDLDVSILDEIPPGRGKVKTKLFKEEKSQEVYALVRDLVKSGRQASPWARQAYIVYPIIEESQKLDLKAAVEMFHHFEKHEFKDFRVGLVHGQMNRKAAEAVMEKFKTRQIDVLVATTVLEVGIDVPNANIMVVEHAERFGLAQLHQLRGRIGRGANDAWCFLIADPTTPDALARLRAVLSTTDGFKIAEEDLRIRGPGEFFGRRQHGLNELKNANPATQLDILGLARQEAIELTKSDARLQKPQNAYIRQIIQKRYPAYLVNVEAG